jgi:aryl-alcohol dehydrogenase-like predicted oxidoreductase
MSVVFTVDESTLTMRLGLGTVQFGVPYGVAGPGVVVSESEASRILAAAWERGLRILDTAPGYGDVEERLSKLCAGRRFEVVSKIGAIPRSLDDAEKLAWALDSVRRSKARLGELLTAVLFHDSSDLSLFIERGLLDELCRWGEKAHVVMGVSTYDPLLLKTEGLASSVRVVQVPGSAFDQQVADVSPVSGVQIHVRSVFLQGLLTMSPASAAQRVPGAGSYIRNWNRWCSERSLTPVEAALSIVKGFPVDVCLVGVQEPRQFAELADAWDRTLPIGAPDLRVAEQAVIDPRQW